MSLLDKSFDPVNAEELFWYMITLIGNRTKWEW